MLRYRVLAEADEEIDGEAGYFDLESPGTARRFLKEYFAVRDFALENPRAAQRLSEFAEHEVRGFPFTRFPHMLVVVVRPEELVGIAVAHQRRRPGYWKSRLDDL